MNGAIILVQDYSLDIQKYFVPIRNAIEKQRINKEFRWANLLDAVQALGTKKGARVFYRWRRTLMNRFEEMDDYKLTIFERLRKKRNTVFDKLRASRKR